MLCTAHTILCSSAHGTLYEYDRAYDRISSVRFEKPLQPLDRVRYNPTTHDDPILLDEAAKPAQAGADGTAAPVRIFATDSILALLMTANRSLYPWDVVVTVDPVGNIFLDKRDGGAFDFVSVNENAADPPLDANEAAALADGKDAKSATAVNSINTPGNLSLEATFINQNFAFQVVNEKKSKQLPGGPNPFYDAAAETDTLASCGYRYRKWDVSSSADEPVEIYVRTEVDALLPPASKGAAPQYITIKTLNEFDSRAQGAGGAPDWRSKLDAQRGAVVATEMKNNSAKLARFAVQSILAGADNMKMG
jgi:translation initiation factor 3 subunit D